MRCWF